MKNNLPKHIAIIMDGNGRWAQRQRYPRLMGHRAGVETVRCIVKACVERKIEVLTLFAFGCENWRRPQEEVSYLHELMLSSLQREVTKLNKNNIRIRFIGDTSQFNKKLYTKMQEAQVLTAGNTGMQLVLAANYSGQWDLLQASKIIAEEYKRELVKLEDITADYISTKLCTAGMPEPDLFIRTSGELRVSNFLLWQLAYTELYFTDVMWPEFSEQHLDEALEAYSTRRRRFGYTNEQMELKENV